MHNWQMRPIFKIAIILTLLVGLSSCIEEPSIQRDQSSGVQNTSSTVSIGHGRYLKDNPIILSGNTNLSQNVNLATLLDNAQSKITTKNQLIKDCSVLSECFLVTEDVNIEPFISSDNKWAFSTDSTEFLQVNTYAHTEILYERYLTDFTFHTTFVANVGSSPSPNSIYPTSIPMAYTTNSALWGGSTTLRLYADSDVSNNAFYSSSTQEIQLGFDEIYKDKVKLAQDSTVIYHELGHKFVDTMINLRNNSDTSNFETTSLGFLSYDEARAMNEGIADYFSFYVNNRTHMGEWGLGRFNIASRPLTESDPLHAAGIGDDDNSRLSYPNYLNYNPNNTSSNLEDVHHAGQILSHYLVALTSDIENYCTVTRSRARSTVINILNEALSELGDLSSKGNDSYTGLSTVNMSQDLSSQWIEKNNPITYRRLAQYIAKYAKYILTMSSSANIPACPGLGMTNDIIEQTLDKYGLLLFRTYNESGNGDDISSFVGSNTSVNPLNRTRTELLSKDLLIQEARSQYTEYIVFDNRDTIKNIMTSLIKTGVILSNQIDTENFGYNNGNGRVSPGEVVGMFVNLYNNSNSTMGGVRVNAADWLYMNDDKPCSNLSDNFPSLSQGGQTCSAFSMNDLSPVVDEQKYQPACMIEYNDGQATKILSQKDYFEQLKDNAGLLEKDCLDPSSTRNCMIRAISGADHSFLSKIDAKSNWLETVTDSDGSPSFTTGNLIYFEVNKNIPIGTRIHCKLRTAFTNCDDCHHDSSNSFDDFEDWQYATEAPYNIINIDFQVTD